ncbi:MAG: cell wall-binding repeat-containing protein [Acidimicrobiales bacterium]|nr:cell wall-binding repeat-containing protein [Acidimicrobiales bacterium]
MRTDEMSKEGGRTMLRHDRHRLLPRVLGALALVTAVVAMPEPADAAVRVGGIDRYETAALISGQFSPVGLPVFVASGENYPDAIAAGWVSGASGAPVLLVRRDSIPPVTRTELARLAPPEIYVLGGSDVVSDAVFGELGATGAAVVRLAGIDRYGTSAAVVSRFAGPPGFLPAVFVASGEDFADAMVAGAAGGVYRWPLLLVRPSGPLPLTVVTELQNLSAAGYTNIVIVGSPADVSPGVEAALGSIAGAPFAVSRLPGADAYQRSVNIWALLAPPVDVVVTTGTNWPDGLAGSLFVGRAQAAGITPHPNVLVLTRPECIPAYVAAAIAGSGASRITILGTDDAVSLDVEAGVTC